jgi:trk system potassium uptake protein
MKNKFLVIGCGRLGAAIANHASEMGENVVVVDTVPASFDRLNDLFSGYKITADASNIRSLEDAYVTSARTVVIVTGDDNVNLFLAHACSQIYGVPEIYVRFDDPDKSALIAGNENVKAIYPSELSFNKFAALSEGGKSR